MHEDKKKIDEVLIQSSLKLKKKAGQTQNHIYVSPRILFILNESESKKLVK